MAGKVPPSMEKLRTKTEYELANDPLGLSPTAAEKIVNRLLETRKGWGTKFQRLEKMLY